MATSRSRVRLLWEACQIPDFRKMADDTHVRLCGKVYGHIVRDGRLPTDWVAGQIAAVSRADGDIDTLMARLTGVRVWSYIAARQDWVADATEWQARAREAEDLISDSPARKADRPLRRPPGHLAAAPPGGAGGRGAAVRGDRAGRGGGGGSRRRARHRLRLRAGP